MEPYFDYLERPSNASRLREASRQRALSICDSAEKTGTITSDRAFELYRMVRLWLSKRRGFKPRTPLDAIVLGFDGPLENDDLTDIRLIKSFLEIPRERLTQSDCDVLKSAVLSLRCFQMAIV
jgi:hypothetical protein